MIGQTSREPRTDAVQVGDALDKEGQQGGDDPGGDVEENVHKVVTLDLSLGYSEAIAQGSDEKKKKQ